MNARSRYLVTAYHLDGEAVSGAQDNYWWIPDADESRRIRIEDGDMPLLGIGEALDRHRIDRVIQAMVPLVGDGRVTREDED